MNFFQKWLKPAKKEEPIPVETDRSSYRVAVMRMQPPDDSYTVETSFASTEDCPTSSSIFDAGGGAAGKPASGTVASRRALVLRDLTSGDENENTGYDPYDTGRFDAAIQPPDGQRE